MIVMFDRETFSGSPEAIVEEMNDTAFLHEATPEAYMRAVAERCLIYKGRGVPACSPALFLRGLASLGLCRIEEDPN